MKKVLLTTIVDNINYGTYLQAYATVKKLTDMGCSVEVLDYLRPHLTKSAMIKKSFGCGTKRAVTALPGIILDSLMKRNVKRFLTSRVKMSRRFSDWNKMLHTLSDFDLYITGSDQVWNSTHNHGIEEVFFFKGIDGVKKSYAASVGLESFPEEQQQQLKELLERYQTITVRESFGVKALEKIGIKRAVQVLDPTFLLTGAEWRAESRAQFKKTEPYLLVYSVEVGRDRETLEIARKIANEHSLKVYLISPYIKFNSRLKVDKLFSMADTEMFLTLFSQADYAVVSSFHGTAFAINFNIQFVTVSPDRFSSRVQSLLQLLNLRDRYITGIADIPPTDFDYHPVNEILNHEREKSLSILKDLISF